MEDVYKRQGTFVREGATFAGAPYISARGLGLKTYAGYALSLIHILSRARDRFKVAYSQGSNEEVEVAR